MASPTQWTWVRVNSGSLWWTGRPGMLQPMGLQRVGHDWETELNWTDWCMHGQSLSCVLLFATLWTVAHQAVCPWDFPGKSSGVGCHFLLQGIFPTQGSNPRLPSLLRFLHLQAGSSPLNHLGSPQIWLYPQEITLFTLFTLLNQGFSPPAQLVCSLSRWFTKQPPS